MKKLLFLIALVLIMPLSLMADPPKKVTLSYAKETKTLKVIAVHKVKDAADHFIDKMVIKVDGDEVKVITPKKQSSLEKEIIEVKVPEIKKGSKVEVSARCNKFGTKKAKIIIE